MRKHGVISAVFLLSLGAVFLTGCDQLERLIGLGPKKQAEAQSQAPVTVASPMAAAVQETQGPLPSDVMVRIGDWSLSSEDFDNRLSLLKQQFSDFKENDPATKGAVLDELIRQQLLVKEAEDEGVGNSKDIEDAVRDFRKNLLVQEMATRLTKDVIATDDDARAYYEANKDKFIEPVAWNAREIVVDDETTAKNILVQVLQGSSFAQIAKTQSKEANAAQGGKLKSFTSGHAPFEAMQTAIDALDAGGVSGVFKGPDGYYIVKVDSKKGGALRSFEDVKKDLVYGLTVQKQQAAVLAHLRELADKIKPQYNKSLIEQEVGKASP